jgi:hypothetical protein
MTAMYYTSFDVTEKGIVLTADQEQRNDLKDIKEEKGLMQAEGDALENLTCNGGMFVLPEDIGALTTATIIEYDQEYYSDFHYYQIRSFVDDLIEEGKAILHKVS